MKKRAGLWLFLGSFLVFSISAGCLNAQTITAPVKKNLPLDAMDRDLLEVTIPQLEEMYRSHKYTVTEVVHWYMARISKYNGIYFRGKPEASRITQIYHDSRTIDTHPIAKQFDFVFVDADHSYEGVKNDTMKAFELMKRSGCLGVTPDQEIRQPRLRSQPSGRGWGGG